MPDARAVVRPAPGDRDVLAARRAGQPRRAESARAGRGGPGLCSRRTAARSCTGGRWRPTRTRSSPARRASAHRRRSSPTSATPRPADCSREHPSLRAGWPALRAQRRDPGARPARARTGRRHAPGHGDTDSERFFALVTHVRGRAPTSARARRGRSMGGGPPAPLRAEPPARDADRAVGPALPRHARALGAPAAGRRAAGRPSPRARQRRGHGARAVR